MGSTMTDTTEAQPEALRLAAWLNEGAWHQMRLGDVLAAGRELRRQHAEIQQLKAREHELEQMHDHSNLVVDAAKEHIAFLEAQLSARQAAPVMVVTEAMHVAAVKVLHRANGVDGLPQRMLDAMLSAAPPPPEREPPCESSRGQSH